MQAYALQKYLEKRGHDVTIIDYVPHIIRQAWFKAILAKDFRKIPSRVGTYIKYKKLNRFIDANLQLTKCYNSDNELKEEPPIFDAYISGSDQIWNQFFTLQGEGRVTLAYFLDFIPENATRISYATSTGFIQASEEYVRVVKPCLQKYAAISVRERGAQRFLEQLEINSVLLPDPTLLLDRVDYTELYYKNISRNVVSYIIHENQRTAKKIHKSMKLLFGNMIDLRMQGLEEWLGYLNNAKFVITNSYHGMIFSILFHRPFCVIPVEGAERDMNDRVRTLLVRLGLEDREVVNEDQLKLLMGKEIDWKSVEHKLSQYRAESDAYFIKAGM